MTGRVEARSPSPGQRWLQQRCGTDREATVDPGLSARCGHRRFAGFTLDLDRLCLHGPSGPIDLRRKNFDVLRYLVEHGGRVVCKEELLGAVWPDVTVNDESLTQCISEIRRALGTEGRRIIKTVARRGYLIDVAIETVNGGTASRSIYLGTFPPQNADPTTSKGAVARAADDITRRHVSTLVSAFGAAAVDRRSIPTICASSLRSVTGVRRRRSKFTMVS